MILKCSPFLLLFCSCAAIAPVTLKERTIQNNNVTQSFIVTNRNTFERVEKLSDDKHIVISIFNVNGTPVSVPATSDTVDVLQVSFDDTVVGKNVISSENARDIVRFYQKYKNVPVVVVQCDAGVSRSAGVAAALMKHVTGDSSQIFKKYWPNMTVYKKVLEAFDNQ